MISTYVLVVKCPPRRCVARRKGLVAGCRSTGQWQVSGQSGACGRPGGTPAACGGPVGERPRPCRTAGLAGHAGGRRRWRLDVAVVAADRPVASRGQRGGRGRTWARPPTAERQHAATGPPAARSAARAAGRRPRHRRLPRSTLPGAAAPAPGRPAAPTGAGARRRRLAPLLARPGARARCAPAPSWTPPPASSSTATEPDHRRRPPPRPSSSPPRSPRCPRSAPTTGSPPPSSGRRPEPASCWSAAATRRSPPARPATALADDTARGPARARGTTPRSRLGYDTSLLHRPRPAPHRPQREHRARHRPDGRRGPARRQRPRPGAPRAPTRPATPPRAFAGLLGERGITVDGAARPGAGARRHVQRAVATAVRCRCPRSSSGC